MRYHTKLKALFAVIAMMTAASLSAVEFPAQSIEIGTGYVVSRNIEREYMPFELCYRISSDELRFNSIAAFQFCENTFDFTIGGDYYPKKTHWQLDYAEIDLGAGLLYHYERYFDLFTEHDGYLESIFKLTFRRFTLKNRLGYGFKAAKIDALSDCKGTLWDGSLSESIIMTFLCKNGLEFYYETASHSLFRFPLFISPHYTLGCAYNFSKGFRISGDFSMRFRDQFTVAPYVDRIYWNFRARYTF